MRFAHQVQMFSGGWLVDNFNYRQAKMAGNENIVINKERPKDHLTV
jgi:hypothetical protein